MSYAAQHLERKFTALGAEALERTRLYLDTNYWANLRDCMLGANQKPAVANLLGILRHAADQGVAICTYSSHTLEEIMKHASADARESTASLMDELSGGFCLANPDRLLDNEIDHWIVQDLAKKTPPFSPTQLAWTRPFFLFLDYEPPRPPVADAESAAKLQTGFIDDVWTMPLHRVVSGIHRRPESFRALEWPQQAAALINHDAPKHASENDSLQEFFLSELNGVLEWAEKRLGHRFREMAERWQLPLIPSTPKEILTAGRVIRQAVMALAGGKRLGTAFAGMQIRSWLHAAVRNDRRRKFKPNDLMDFEHAQTALPHCHYFLTDTPHAQLIADAKLGTRFGCTVIRSVEEACEMLPAVLLKTSRSD